MTEIQKTPVNKKISKIKNTAKVMLATTIYYLMTVYTIKILYIRCCFNFLPTNSNGQNSGLLLSWNYYEIHPKIYPELCNLTLSWMKCNKFMLA